MISKMLDVYAPQLLAKCHVRAAGTILSRSPFDKLFQIALRRNSKHESPCRIRYDSKVLLLAHAIPIEELLQIF